MSRVRYEPRPIDGARDVVTASPFGGERASRGEFLPWVLGEVAANSPPTAAAPSEERIAEIMAAAHREGLAAGRAEAELELEQLRAQFVADTEASLAAVANLRSSIAAACRAELAELALAIAEAVLARELADGPATLDTFVNQALVEMDPHEKCTITVAPDAAAALTEWARSSWPAAVVRADAALRPGELRVDAGSGRIEVTHAKRIERVRRLVLGEGDGP